MNGITLTEDVILTVTGKKASQLSQIRDLDLSDSKIKRVDPDAFKKAVNLRSLKLSSNYIRQLPLDLGLHQLQKLDISENCLGSLEFLQQFPDLEELSSECKGLEPWQSHVAVFLCPKLTKINGKPTAKLQSTVNSCRENLWDLVKSVWEKEFAKNQNLCDLAESDIEKTTTDLLCAVRAKKLSMSEVPAQFKEFLVKRLCEELFRKVLDGTFAAEQMKQKSEEEEEETHSEDEEGQTENGKEPLDDYEPVHFLRCHFCDKKAIKNGHTDDDPTDEITNVWWCAMEPNSQNPAETTGMVATCGGDSVCLIDCSTGLVIKRYRQVNEQFYCLAWSTLTFENEGIQRKTNILAVAGNNGHLKLLHPAQFVCYAEHGSGRPNKSVADFYYSCLMFHPQEVTWLFCGSSDSTITLFDIGVPHGRDYSTEIKQLLVLVTKPSARVMNMVFHESANHLVAGTEQGCYAWDIDVAKIKTKGSSKRCAPSFELQLPATVKFVDGLTLLDADHVACKCVADGCIYVFNLSDALKQKNIEISLLHWCATKTEYISLGSRNGVLACGDDKGNVWLYNLSPWLESRHTSRSQMFFPSRILLWPNCLLGPKEEDRRMTDVLDKPEPLVVNAVTISSNWKYIVGVTDCNLVCIWQRISEVTD